MGKGTRYKHVEKILTKHAKPGNVVLEIGCGGAVYQNLFDKYIGIDLPSSIYKEHGHINIYCDGQTLSFKNGSFDLIFLVACLYQIPDVFAVLNESKRVLKDNGKILIFDYNLKTTRRLKNSERNGNNKNHVWSPFKLNSIVKKAGFKSSIVYDYLPSESREGWKNILLKLKILRYLIFFAVQTMRIEGWNIVVGKKV